MHERPQLHEVVLQRRAGEQQATRGVEGQQRLPALRAKVLDVLRLVEDQVLPALALERVLVLRDEVVRRDAHVEGVGLRPPEALLLALLLRAVVREDLEARAPHLELALPVEHDARRHHDQMRPPDTVLAREVCHQRDGLHRLAEAHLVGQDAVELAVVHGHEPVEANVLVLAQRAA